MIQDGNIWLTIEEVCNLSGDKKETIRRKCKSGQIVSKFEKNGKNKNYYILLSSLSQKVQNKYFYTQPENISISENKITESMNKYSDSPAWAKRNAEKYLELFTLTQHIEYKEKITFLEEWGIKHPEKKTSYSALMNAKSKYESLGIDGLLGKYGNRKGASSVNSEYYEFFKSLYLKEHQALPN